MKKILLVDDEIQILKALARMFLETDYEIFTAENGMDALKLLETNEIDMIISDMRMPILDGYQLLSIVKEKYPKIIRIILSGYAEEKPMFKALLHNIAKFYVFKPWDNNVLLQNVNKLFVDDTILTSSDLLDLIKDMDCTSSMPANCQQLLSYVEEEDIDTLIAEMEKDPVISTLLIQVAKSAVYGVMPNTVKQASVYIGLHNLKCFLHFACVISVTKQTDNIETEPELLWQHAYLTNRIFLFLYETFLHKQPLDSTLFAGLMHNIGLIILLKSLKKKGLINQEALTVNDYVQLELGEYKMKHQELGAYFLNLWEIPFPVYEVALYHHRPLDSNIIFRELVSCIHIARNYAWKALGATELDPISKEVFDTIGITAEDFEKRLARYMK